MSASDGGSYAPEPIPAPVVEPGAFVSNSVVFADSVVQADATVHWSIVDADCTIGRGSRVGDADADALHVRIVDVVLGAESLDELEVLGYSNQHSVPILPVK